MRKVGRDNNILNIYLIQALNNNASRNQQHCLTLHIEIIPKNMRYNYFWGNVLFLGCIYCFITFAITIAFSFSSIASNGYF